MTQQPNGAKKNKTWIYNIAFILICVGLFMFLWSAPEETTAKLPTDENHNRFMAMDKKEAEKLCDECHSLEGDFPLPKDHPPKYRCLFCHKKPVD